MVSYPELQATFWCLDPISRLCYSLLRLRELRSLVESSLSFTRPIFPWPGLPVSRLSLDFFSLASDPAVISNAHRVGDRPGHWPRCFISITQMERLRVARLVLARVGGTVQTCSMLKCYLIVA